MSDGGTDSETNVLRARVAELEHELSEQSRRTNVLVAEAQERTYWLDRWNLDLNALMRRPGAAQARAVVRAMRGLVRLAVKARRRLTAVR